MALPHVVLGIPRDASIDEVTAAYRRLSMKMHPDRPGGSVEEFQRVKAAYDALRTKLAVRGGPFDDLFAAAATANKQP